VAVYRKAEKQWMFGPSRTRNIALDGPKQKIQDGAKAENTIWGKNKKKHAEANAENTSGPHDVGRLSVAPHHMVAAPAGGCQHVVIIMWVGSSFSIRPGMCFCFCPVLYFLFSPQY